jgi:hypothetical protein
VIEFADWRVGSDWRRSTKDLCTDSTSILEDRVSHFVERLHRRPRSLSEDCATMRWNTFKFPDTHIAEMVDIDITKTIPSLEFVILIFSELHRSFTNLRRRRRS